MDINGGVAWISKPLSEPLLDATAAALTEHERPSLWISGFRFTEYDYSLAWLERFRFVHRIDVNLYDATSFDVLSTFTNAVSVAVGETRSSRPSLSFLRRLPQVRELSLDAQGRDFEAVATLPALERLRLYRAPVKTLEPLRGHPQLEMLEIAMGGVRDLTALPDIPRLRGLAIFALRQFDTAALDPAGSCESLEAVSLEALQHVRDLSALARGPALSLRYLLVANLRSLRTLTDLTACRALREVFLATSRPADRDLAPVAALPTLRHLSILDSLRPAEVEQIDHAFSGDALRIGANILRGVPGDFRARWRASLPGLLGAVPI